MSENILVKWYCPKCCDWWAVSELNMDIAEPSINPDDFKMREGYEEHKITGDVICPKCKYVYERMDIYVNIAKALYPEQFLHYPKRKD